LIQERAVEEMPHQDERRSKRIVSKAVDKSRSVRRVTCGWLSFDDMIMNGEKSSFSRVMLDIGRLERNEQTVDR